MKHAPKACHSDSGLLKDLWTTGTWRIFPLCFASIVGVAIIIPITPTLLTNFFASRNAGRELHCQDYKHIDLPEACINAHSEIVFWGACTSFVSSSLLSFFLAPLIGSWSDALGRKPFLLLSYAAVCCQLAVLVANINYSTSLLWYFPAQALTGAFSSTSLSLAYIADLLQPVHRAASFGLILAAFSLGVLIGPLLGSQMDPVLASWVSFGTCVGCVLYTLLLLPESLTEDKMRSAREVHAGQGGIQVLSGMVKALKILLRSKLFIKLTLCMMITGVVLEGLQDLLMQYLQLKLDFGVTEQAKLYFVFGISGLVMQTLGLKYMLSAFGEQIVLCIGLVATIAQQLVLTFATADWMAYAAIAMGSIGMVSFPAISSIKSNNAEEHEQGAVQGALYGARALAQGTGPLMFAALFALFSRTDSPVIYFPGAPFVFGSVLTLGALAVAATIPRLAGQSPHQRVLASDEESLLPATSDASAIAAVLPGIPISAAAAVVRSGSDSLNLKNTLRERGPERGSLEGAHSGTL